MEFIIIKQTYPSEIIAFLNSVFEIYEIRGQVGTVNGIKFVVRSKENCHSVPHVHAEYGEHQISIDIITGEVRSGNLPKKNQKIATDWVKTHRQQLLDAWDNMALSAISSFTKSGITSINNPR